MGGSLSCDGSSEQQDVWLRLVDHVVNPSWRLLHTYSTPLLLGHETTPGHQFGYLLGKHDMSVCVEGRRGGREREREVIWEVRRGSDVKMRYECECRQVFMIQIEWQYAGLTHPIRSNTRWEDTEHAANDTHAL